MLHGDIEANSATIGSWSATRIKELKGGFYVYAFSLTERDRTTSGTVDHRYSDGASILASKILARRPWHWPTPSIVTDGLVGPHER